ncbi:hypothetical protein CKAH01_06661 [Colletotrichum kahawae]|uniref:Uncharacterized protein n=1 Tax=Colletotrichum kahawae TaxID=34407 RepID=A0AAE0D3F3_COLKA|nr:hypothetical protein CKAH01_06661 [Colletotrichum kahawae]
MQDGGDVGGVGGALKGSCEQVSVEEGRTEEEWRMRENRGDVRGERLLWETAAQDGSRGTSTWQANISRWMIWACDSDTSPSFTLSQPTLAERVSLSPWLPPSSMTGRVLPLPASPAEPALATNWTCVCTCACFAYYVLRFPHLLHLFLYPVLISDGIEG